MTNATRDQNSDLKEKKRGSSVLKNKKPEQKTYGNILSSQDKILQDLDEMYQVAFANQNFAIALRALELRGKHLGLFGDRKTNQMKTLDQMSEEELQALLK